MASLLDSLMADITKLHSGRREKSVVALEPDDSTNTLPQQVDQVPRKGSVKDLGSSSGSKRKRISISPTLPQESLFGQTGIPAYLAASIQTVPYCPSSPSYNVVSPSTSKLSERRKARGSFVTRFIPYTPQRLS